MSSKTYTGESQDLAALAQDIRQWFKGDGFEVQSADNAGVHLIQARKTSGVRTFFGTNQAFTVKIEGSPDVYTVEVGTGKWVENLTGAGVAGLFTGGITWVTAGVGAAWTKKIEGDLWSWLERRHVQKLGPAAPAPTPAAAAPAAAPAAANAPSIPEQIKKLAELRDMGILSPEEFETKKKELLSRM